MSGQKQKRCSGEGARKCVFGRVHGTTISDRAVEGNTGNLMAARRCHVRAIQAQTVHVWLVASYNHVQFPLHLTIPSEGALHDQDQHIERIKGSHLPRWLST